MYGLGITLGQNESQAPQAAQDLAKVILDDLEAMDRKTISKEDAADEAVESKERRKRLAKSSMAQATDSGAKLKKPVIEKQPLAIDAEKRKEVVKLCNVDINKIHDDETLEAWHRSIDVTDFHVFEILGYILLLRSTIKLEAESGHF
ncbi:hypothetical protein HD554DRAFT_2034480 [Boletus coccyginus]|nr:hypothetical protein HD554DRAFT_2034480 [Boletus coccyginus]